MSLIIKKVELLDLPAIEKIGKICLPLYYSGFDLLPLFFDPNHFCLKVVDEDQPKQEIMGFMVAEYKDQKTRIHIKSLGTLPEHRRKGVAQLLVNYLKQQKEENPELKKLTLYVLEDNFAAIKFYAKQKFKAAQKLKNYYQSLNKDGYYLVCNLDFSKKSARLGH